MPGNESLSFIVSDKEQDVDHRAIFNFETIPGFLSVIVPAYDDVNGLEVTLQALTKQTLSAEQFEIIVANDGGNKAISQLCNRYQVRETILATNQGSYAARNVGLQCSKGEFLAFIDADVVPDNYWIERGLAGLMNNRIVAGKTTIKVSDNRRLVELYQSIYAFPTETYVQNFATAQTVNLFIRRSVFEESGLFDSRMRSGGDIEFTYRISKSCKGKIAFIQGVRCEHPARNFKQLIQANKRIFYGQLSSYVLYPDWRLILSPNISQAWKLLFPPKFLPDHLTKAYSFTLSEKLGTYFFSWLIKLNILRYYLTIFIPYILGKRSGNQR